MVMRMIILDPATVKKSCSINYFLSVALTLLSKRLRPLAWKDRYEDEETAARRTCVCTLPRVIQREDCKNCKKKG